MSAEPNHSANGTVKTDLLKIGDFARLAGTNLRTLRYYEEIGLLIPAARSAGGFRYYRPTDVNRLRTVNALQELGLSLEKIREMISTRGEGGGRREFLARVEASLSAQRDLFEERIKELRERQARIQVALEKLDACRECEHVPNEENNFCEPCHQTGRTLPEDLSALF